uniref:Uncharacterized protein n=1 Tax=Cyprinus carpio TaxID=7962 RepID=A0A8C1RZ39_CYPCA
MKSVNAVKMFAVFALVFLVSSVTEGLIISKYERLITLTCFFLGSDAVVCLAGATGFNTSFVKNIPAKPKDDQLACDSGMNPSLNVCNTSCTAFTDDDVTDDIALHRLWTLHCILNDLDVISYWCSVHSKLKVYIQN